MKIRNYFLIIFLLFEFLALQGCLAKTNPLLERENVIFVENEKQLIDAFISVQEYQTIEIAEGVYNLRVGLNLYTNNVVVKGQGFDKTILKYDNQLSGGEGVLVSADNFIIQDLAIENAKGDALKINNGENIIVRGIRVEWTNGPNEDNGSYGIYPVMTSNVLLEENLAIAAADAGIYVGQSNNVIVRRNKSYKNVAGIEIENTISADVYDNYVEGNTSGVLVFNMPELSQVGAKVRIYENRIHNNNHPNFAPKGTPVSFVPAGTGVVVNANDFVEIFNNEIGENITANILVSSGQSFEYSPKYTSASYDPFPEAIYIRNNIFSPGGTRPVVEQLEILRTLTSGINGHLPDLIWDGLVPDDYELCLFDSDIRPLNMRSFSKKFDTPKNTHCSLHRLAEVKLTKWN